MQNTHVSKSLKSLLVILFSDYAQNLCLPVVTLLKSNILEYGLAMIRLVHITV